VLIMVLLFDGLIFTLKYYHNHISVTLVLFFYLLLGLATLALTYCTISLLLCSHPKRKFLAYTQCLLDIKVRLPDSCYILTNQLIFNFSF